MKVNFVTSSDWEGLYVDGELVLEGHSISAMQVLRALKIAYTSVEADDDWLYDVGRLPEKIEDIVVKHP